MADSALAPDDALARDEDHELVARADDRFFERLAISRQVNACPFGFSDRSFMVCPCLVALVEFSSHSTAELRGVCRHRSAGQSACAAERGRTSGPVD